MGDTVSSRGMVRCDYQDVVALAGPFLRQHFDKGHDTVQDGEIGFCTQQDSQLHILENSGELS